MERQLILKRDKNCPLCDVSNSKFDHFARYGVTRLDQYKVLESDNFLVKPDVLPGNPDGRHVLIYPKFHVYNHAELSSYIPEMGRVVYQLEQKLGPLVIFEHGGIKAGNNHQSVYHAHIHAYAGLEGVDIIEWMRHMLSGGLGEDEIYPYKILPAPDYAFLANLNGNFKGYPYLYVEQGSWAIMVEDSEGKMQSQVTQRSMHLFFSGEILDWKKIPENEEYAQESVRRLANLVDLCEHGIYNAHAF